MGDLKSRLIFLVLALIVFRIGTHVPVPGIDPVQLAKLFDTQGGGVLGMFNMFSGGALSRFSVFALGIMPYISASIIMQLLTVVSPQLEALKKEGEAGRRKITQYTRYGTVALALFQAVGISIALESQQGLVVDPGMMFRFVTVVTLVGGTMFLMVSLSSSSRALLLACRARSAARSSLSITVRCRFPLSCLFWLWLYLLPSSSCLLNAASARFW
jgi:preprotein translocase subunit SecY